MVENAIKKITVPDIIKRKNKTPIVALTAYHAHTAQIADKHVDILLVGDSLGMVMHGYKTTLQVPLKLMIMHAQAVVRGAEKALVIVDMPFATYEESPKIAFRNAAKIIKKTGCQAVKIEGGKRMKKTISYLTKRGIPVMAHIGLTPQYINMLGGYKIQGREKKQWQNIEDDAQAVQDAGAFALVIEAVAEPLAEKITKNLSIPTIGIGASAQCDGQILVMEDMLGLSKQTPKFVKTFGNVSDEINRAIRTYAQEVKKRNFPAKENLYPMKEE